MSDGIHQHIDIHEKGKENAFSLGQSLWIDNEVSHETYDPHHCSHPFPPPSASTTIILSHSPKLLLWVITNSSLFFVWQEFEDLDEIIARHVQPMAAFARDILNYKYFLTTDGTAKDGVEKQLREEKSKGPSKYVPFTKLL